MDPVPRAAARGTDSAAAGRAAAGARNLTRASPAQDKRMHIQTERAARSVCAYTQKAHDKNVRMHQHQVRGEQPRPRGRVSRRRYYY